jgi:hypothetical protein
MALNISAGHNAPSNVLNMMGCIPSMYTSVKSLGFRFQYRLMLTIRPFTLLSSIRHTHQQYHIAPDLWKRFSRNRLWRLFLNTVPTPSSPSPTCRAFQIAEVQKWCAQKSSCRRAFREIYDNDPFLYYPATKKERLRLIKWRLHWLPSFPAHNCRCGAPTVKRDHYVTCPIVKDTVVSLSINLPDSLILVEEQDLATPSIHLLDRLLNALSSSPSMVLETHWELTWPLILKWISLIDYANHPAGTFDLEPTAGDLFRDFLVSQRNA